ncbi:RNA polymerase II transcription factor SIII subunit A-domain-containing protein [Hypoxylon sp. FL1284]|nr:RNA polymerase II transcription factor SIII subunit A-domain-containing protein [Hypoxylon sp. FL1284]
MVKSLVHLCTMVCIKNIRDIHDVGGAPYHILRPILLKIDSAAHLRELEENSPHIRADDAECWIRLIKRDFTVEYQKEQLRPSNPESWHKVYAKYEKAVAERNRAADEALSQAYKKLEREKASNVTSVVKYDKKVFGKLPVRRTGRHDSGGGALRFGGGSRTKTTSAQSIMKKARREAGEIAMRNRLSTPTGQLPVRQGQITKAPLGLQMEHEIKSLPHVARIHAPQQRKQPQWDIEQKKRDERLLRAKKGAPAKGPTIVSDDELDPDDDMTSTSNGKKRSGMLDVDDLEGLFDADEPTASTGASRIKKTSATPSSTRSAASPPSRSAPMNPLAKMKLGRAWKDKPMTISRVETSPPKPSPATSPPRRSMQSSPPAPATHSPTAGPTAGSDQPQPKPKPMMGQKRKQAPSIFMKPKPKVRRMS